MKTNEIYKTNKSSKCGSEIICPVCGTHFIKIQWQQAFCCSKCKDRFWNGKGDRHADPDYYSKYNQKHPERYIGLLGLGESRAEIEHNNAMYELATNKDFRDYVNSCNDNFDGDWDSHDAVSNLSTLYDNYISDNQ